MWQHCERGANDTAADNFNQPSIGSPLSRNTTDVPTPPERAYRSISGPTGEGLIARMYAWPFRLWMSVMNHTVQPTLSVQFINALGKLQQFRRISSDAARRQSSFHSCSFSCMDSLGGSLTGTFVAHAASLLFRACTWIGSVRPGAGRDIRDTAPRLQQLARSLRRFLKWP
jgi:hypothetical protein